MFKMKCFLTVSVKCALCRHSLSSAQLNAERRENTRCGRLTDKNADWMKSSWRLQQYKDEFFTSLLPCFLLWVTRSPQDPSADPRVVVTSWSCHSHFLQSRCCPNAGLLPASLYSATMLSLEQVKQSLDNAQQPHVLQFWPELCETERAAFLQELSQLDLKGLKDHCERAAQAATSPPANLDFDIEPVPPQFIGSVKKSDPKCLTEWQTEGILFYKDYGNAWVL